MIDQIRNWPICDFDGLAKFIANNWSHDGPYVSVKEGKIQLSTGGDPDNEMIIDALRHKNKGAWWKIHLEAFHRGGHYTFSTPFK